MADIKDQEQAKQFQQFLTMQQLQQQLQDVLIKVTEICWDKCNPNVGRVFSSSDSTCMQNCAARYLDVSQFVAQRILKQGKTSQ